MQKTILLTGASGTMGSRTLTALHALGGKIHCRILLRQSKKNQRLARRLQKYYPSLEIQYGDIQNYGDCMKAVQNTDYILHCAAIIPPRADHAPDETYRTNYEGTLNLLKAVTDCGQTARTKFVYIGTVAAYGNRTFKHPWGRTGDPLMPSVCDIYGASKLRAERAVIESPLCWVSLRQTGILYDEILFNNMNDGLMFHTCWNTPMEWTTAETSGLLMKNLIEKDMNGRLPADFWRKVYNIGNGKEARVTGYETIDRGFKLMGRSAEDLFQPEWNSVRNFHCMWFADSYILNDYLDFWYDGFEAFFLRLEKKLWYFKLGKPFPRLIKRFALMPLLRTDNAPLYWLKQGNKKRITAFFGSPEAHARIPRRWKDFFLLCKNKNPETGAFFDYEALKDEGSVKEKNLLLDHGYDETKPDTQLALADMQQAAAFRGGTCLSTEMTQGDLYTPLQWQCHNGHSFGASPYLVLKTGHWCPECCMTPPWNFDELSKHIPFYAQVWYDDHLPDESNPCTAEESRL